MAHTVCRLLLPNCREREASNTALMVAAEAWVGEGDGRALFLDTHVTNAETRAFYGAIGYGLGVMLMKEL